jgi:hypothetical protein
VRLVNSSELRAIKLKMDQATVMLDMPKRRSGSKAAHVVKDRLILTGESENEILRRCYWMPSLHYLKLGRTALGRTALGRMALGRTWHWAEIFP